MNSQVLLLVVSPVYPPLIPPPICLPPCGWALPSAMTHTGALYKPIQFPNLAKKEHNQEKKKKAIILRLVSWIKEGLLNAKSGANKEYQSLWLLEGT